MKKNSVKKLETIIGERTMQDNLIVLDDVTGLADKSHSFVKLIVKSMVIMFYIYSTNLL